MKKLLLTAGLIVGMALPATAIKNPDISDDDYQYEQPYYIAVCDKMSETGALIDAMKSEGVEFGDYITNFVPEIRNNPMLIGAFVRSTLFAWNSDNKTEVIYKVCINSYETLNK